jgi:hypothetical protein
MILTRRMLLAAGAAALFTDKSARADASGRYLSAAASFAGRYATKTARSHSISTSPIAVTASLCGGAASRRSASRVGRAGSR